VVSFRFGGLFGERGQLTCWLFFFARFLSCRSFLFFWCRPLFLLFMLSEVGLRPRTFCLWDGRAAF